MAKEIMYGGDLPLIHPTNEERAAYNEVLLMYRDAFGKDYTGTKLAILPGEIRSEVELTGPTNAIVWNIRRDEGNGSAGLVLPTENRLDENDAFIVRQMSVMFALKAATDPYNLMELHTFDNSIVFGTATPAVTASYNGTLSMSLNAVRYLDRLGMQAFRYASTAQQGVEPSTGSEYVADSFSAQRAWKDCVPQFRIKGNDKCEFELKLPNPGGDFAIEDFTVIAVLMLRGLKVQNGATYRTVTGK